MVDSGGRPAVIDGYASADVVACSQASVLFRVSRLRDGDVALKVFQLGGTPSEQGFARTRMLRDWRIWSELAHPHVMPVHDFGERDDSLYVATPWVNGPSLRAVLDQRRTLAPPHVRQLATQAASALDAAAALRLIHLDLKPENVLFASADQVVHAYVTDFGAGSLAAREVGADRSKTFRGTFEYAAPEQLQGGSIDRRAMVYSLGCLLYETLTGATPYAGRARDASPPPVEDAPPEVGLVFAKALAYRREERYATCVDFAGALCEALALARAPDPAPVIRRRRSYGLRHVTVVASVLLVACGAATGASWLMHGAKDGSHPAPGAAVASHDFLAALPEGGPTAKSAPRSLRAAPSAKRVSRNALGDAPASVASRSGATRTGRHGVSETSRPPATSAADNATSGTARVASSRVGRQATSASAPSLAGTSLPATTTSAAASTLQPPPPPPASSDPTPPLPPPPP